VNFEKILYSRAWLRVWILDWRYLEVYVWVRKSWKLNWTDDELFIFYDFFVVYFFD
jgi:hypothetical protein